MPRLLLVLMAALLACTGGGEEALTISASAVGAEGEILARQLREFELERGVPVEVRMTPDDATQRHQLYVQWLNARIPSPDVLQLDVVWTPELAAAGWLEPLGRPEDLSSFIPATVEANSWRGEVYAIPWFVDVGMLYRRTDLVPEPPPTLERLAEAALAARSGDRSGFVWQGARYEGLVTVFLEILTAHGGSILDEHGRPMLSSSAGRAALGWMRAAVASGVTPPAALTWHEEESRFAFQNGRAAFMRNWPYAVPLLEEPESSAVAGRFAISAMPPAVEGMPSAATLGGAQLAINRWSEKKELARALIDFLTTPEKMLERAAATGQYPSRSSLYATEELDRALGTDSAEVRNIVTSAVARPSTPVYAEISELLQIELHRALSGEIGVDEALRRADAAITRVLRASGLIDEGAG